MNTAEQIDAAWDHANAGGRVALGRVIVEGVIDFDYEITLLTVRAMGRDGAIETHFCEPIGHVQVSGDYVESWQPHPMRAQAQSKAKEYARAVTDDLGGTGIFGVELFVKQDAVWFSEISPRPHDTGMVTMATQWQSEFELHARAMLELPVDTSLRNPGASGVIYGGDLRRSQHTCDAIRWRGRRAGDHRHRCQAVRQARVVHQAPHGSCAGTRGNHRRSQGVCGRNSSTTCVIVSSGAINGAIPLMAGSAARSTMRPFARHESNINSARALPP